MHGQAVRRSRATPMVTWAVVRVPQPQMALRQRHTPPDARAQLAAVRGEENAHGPGLCLQMSAGAVVPALAAVHGLVRTQGRRQRLAKTRTVLVPAVEPHRVVELCPQACNHRHQRRRPRERGRGKGMGATQATVMGMGTGVVVRSA